VVEVDETGVEMQLSEEQLGKALTTLNAGDAMIALQVISRLLQVGAIRENELAVVGMFRNRVVDALNTAAGINYDEILLAEQQAKAAAEQTGAAPAGVVTNDDTKGRRSKKKQSGGY
jgi:hypothetical protein